MILSALSGLIGLQSAAQAEVASYYGKEHAGKAQHLERNSILAP